MRTNLKIGSLLGVPIGLNYSWFVTLVLITVFFGLQIFPLMLPDETRAVQWALALGTTLAFFISVLAHEMVHALVARGFGVPVRGITLFIFGGMAQIERDARSPAAEFVIAVVGPATSFGLAALFFVVWVATGSSDSTGSIAWEWLWLINLAVGLINLVPAFPFDGGRILRSLVWATTGNFQSASKITSILGQVVAYGLIAAGLLSLLVQQPFDLGALPELWLVLIGLFLENAARNSHEQVRVDEILSTRPAAHAMTNSYELVEHDTSIRELLEGPFADNGKMPFAFVTNDANVVGVVAASEARKVPAERADTTRASEVMTPAQSVQVVQRDELLADVVARMDTADVDVIPVVDDGRLAGLVSRQQIDNLVSGKTDPPE